VQTIQILMTTQIVYGIFNLAYCLKWFFPVISSSTAACVHMHTMTVILHSEP